MATLFLRIVGLEKQQLGDDQRGRDVLDRPDTKMMRSRSRREKMSNDRSPRADCSMTIGTRLLLIIVDRDRAWVSLPGESNGVADP